eukprot:TRINITY_DN7707_c0_g2_i1.p1 TRINITY_DN7707_c0_g2~~TRINITY_DN7707_c0_g2_i1.p1  ORF type:complete len:152 (-),score=27.33 TRINITY_DN7707_c0_g2_i1:23-427(-)
MKRSISHFKNKIKLVSTREHLDDIKIVKELGIVSGSATFTSNMIKDIWAKALSLISTEITPYSQLNNRVSAEATKNMIEEAEHMGANAIIQVEYQNNVHLDPLIWSASYCFSTVTGSAIIIEEENIEISSKDDK